MKFNEKNLFEFKISLWNKIIFFLLIGLILFVILFDKGVIPIPQINEIEYVLNYIYIYFFGIQIKNYLLIIYLALIVMLLESVIGFLRGIIGLSINLIFYILLYALFTIPFGLVRFGFEVDVFNISLTIDISILLYMVIGLKILFYFIEITEYVDFRKGTMLKSNDIGEIKVIHNKDNTKTFIPSFEKIPKGTFIFMDNEFQSIDIKEKAIIKPNYKKEKLKKEKATQYFFD